MKESLPVLFRVDKRDSSDVFALFPSLPGTNEPHTCMCYQPIGQHSSADISACIASSRPALPPEYADLLAELAWIYDDCDLKIVQRISHKMRADRRAALRGEP